MALTGYLITQYRDINPQSPTYNQIREERTQTSECQPTAPDWVELTAYCEYGEDGQPTGQYVHVEIDQAKNSETYGQTREWKEAASEGQCEMADDDPQWVLDETYDNHCETKVFEPSKVVGETGRFICRIIDENVYSPTYGQRVETAFTESDWIFEEEFPCEAVDTRPNVEEISYSCVLSADTSAGTMVQTGEIDIFGMDKNPYSSTYLQTITIRSVDTERCTPSTNICTKYEFADIGVEIAASGVTQALCYSTVEESALVFDAAKSSSWITYTRTQVGRVYQSYICTVSPNESTLERVGYAVFTSSDGCEFTATVTQSGKAQETYEIGYTLTSTRTRFRTPINYIHGSASIFTQSELSTEIDIIPYIEPESGCEALTIKAITLADLLNLAVDDSLYEDVVGTNLCIVSGIRISVPTDPTNIRGRIVLTQRS